MAAGSMAFLSIVRRWALRAHLSLRAIARWTKLSRIEAIAPLVRDQWLRHQEAFAVPGGERTKLRVAQIKLSHSRAFLRRAYPLQTHDPLVPFPAEMHYRATVAV